MRFDICLKSDKFYKGFDEYLIEIAKNMVEQFKIYWFEAIVKQVLSNYVVYRFLQVWQGHSVKRLRLYLAPMADPNFYLVCES